MLGVGGGALVDAIVFHLVLGWHHLLSAVAERTGRPASEADHLAVDGTFMAVMLTVALAGGILVWRSGRISSAVSAGLLGRAIVGGWGAFNVFDIVVDHHLLVLHRLRHPVDEPLVEAVVLVASLAGVAIGLTLIRARPATRGAP